MITIAVCTMCDCSAPVFQDPTLIGDELDNSEGHELYGYHRRKDGSECSGVGRRVTPGTTHYFFDPSAGKVLSADESEADIAPPHLLFQVNETADVTIRR